MRIEPKTHNPVLRHANHIPMEILLITPCDHEHSPYKD